ncbi:carbohydrate ABC transporter permease [Lachnospiraceae bacterium oral taxon 500]|nr:carbohydrate ABC transporter permease [Lachnospiraceae bacterium oral taxon 500]
MKKQFSGEKIFQIFDITLMCIFMVLVLIPVFTVLMTSFVSEAEIAQRGTFIIIPQKFDFSAYKMLLASGKNILRAYGNTLFRVLIGTFLNLLFTITLAYGLSRKNLKGRNLFTAFVFFTMFFSGGLIPTFILVKSLNLLDSRWSMIFPGLINTWNLLIMRNFFYAIPKSLEEAAIIDGANDMQILTKVVLPLSKASIATIGLFYAVAHWNAWFDAMLYINKTSLLPMQNILRNIITAASNIGDLGAEAYNSLDVIPPSQSIRAATIVITTLPILTVYPFIQKYFVKGVMVGSIKG